MIRISRTTMRRLSPRATVISGAALGLIAGATVYGAVSSSAEPASHTAFKAPKAPVAAAAHLANCKTGAKLEKGVCVVHVRRTVVEAAEAGEGAKDAHVAGAIPSSILKPAAKKADSEAAEAAAAKAAKAAVKPTAPAPVPTKAPVPTVAPVATVAPVPTQAPVPTPTPTSTAKATATPAPSAAS